MKDYNFFDIIGPIMIGPSSSHTAGAARIAKSASKIVSRGFTSVVFFLHGSFAETYLGHGTDKALIAGVLGFEPDDERIKTSYEIAKEKNLGIEFRKVKVSNAHPNTVEIQFNYPDEHTEHVTGISIGGGSYELIELNGLDVSLDGKHPTIIMNYYEQKGVISSVSSILADNNYNIATIRNIVKDDNVSLIIELDVPLKDEILEEIKALNIFKDVKYIELN
ncbi:MAG: L-serine ammonia-lyase, iron-sulfur-dependent, subunit beta [Tissierellia bacterium]|nr:L-serine ammonia-lyase, iron-sulfur-dependent, subunit beta [Tissierellia bacterium]